MDQPNQVNVPAFQRKRSISARARKKIDYTSSRPPKKTRARTGARVKKVKIEAIEPLTELPIAGVFPSENIFTDPLIDDAPKVKNSEIVEMQTCGICEGYFDKIDVAIVRLTQPLRNGDLIIFEKQDGLFQQPVKSMQINRRDVKLARTGSDIGLKVVFKPKVGTLVYKII